MSGHGPPMPGIGRGLLCGFSGFPVRPLAAVKGKHDKPVCAYKAYAGIGFVYALFLVQKVN